MVGFGFDSHRIIYGRKLWLGGILIDENFGPVSHSDGDVVIHSLIDALLGAIGGGDIGTLFPDSNHRYKDIPSAILLEKVIEILRRQNKSIINLDFTIVFELKKLGEYKEKIRENICKMCGLSSSQVNIKAKTNEKMGYIGRGEGIEAYCICQVD